MKRRIQAMSWMMRGEWVRAVLFVIVAVIIWLN